ncbi:unnamed protein product [Ciceribacter selenitireducens ATCC BAA-1503]|uniref:Uncharacterized protein n=1 Tax=Ciceribacter selenitireducens ATCC BAA-1503 TaxID=1336235 RepID=A0A376AK53_9HYPH|nr:unnamed protein product [Ciceribacter selenitireducens ATCC BAA-1503]
MTPPDALWRATTLRTIKKSCVDGRVGKPSSTRQTYPTDRASWLRALTISPIS